jgi:hypothetical protein
MAKHTVRDAVHVAVWRFVSAMHEGGLEELLGEPIFTSHATVPDHYVPALAKYQVKQLSGESERVITDTLATLVDEEVLIREPRAYGVTAAGESIRWHGQPDHSHPEFTTLWVPTLLPQSSDVVEDWPDREVYADPFSQVAAAAESQEEALIMWNAIEGMSFGGLEEFKAMMEPVNSGEQTLREAVAEAADQ